MGIAGRAWVEGALPLNLLPPLHQAHIAMIPSRLSRNAGASSRVEVGPPVGIASRRRSRPSGNVVAVPAIWATLWGMLRV